jgi:hypothetical protein
MTAPRRGRWRKEDVFGRALATARQMVSDARLGVSESPPISKAETCKQELDSSIVRMPAVGRHPWLLVACISNAQALRRLYLLIRQ